MITNQPEAGPERVAPTGVRNFRDAGGVGSLPRGVLYRSAALHSLHGLAAEGADTLRRLGLRTVVDLRSDPEMAERPDAVDLVDARYLHAPVFTERRWPADQLELYPLMAERAGAAAVTVLRRLLVGGGEAAPVLVHCASGKDRTGVVVAVLQTLLGASEAEVLQDFLRSNDELGLAKPPPAGAAHNALPVREVHLRRALLSIRSHHGSVAEYLLAHGAQASELAEARRIPA
ncbi:tyrosine-protein phosphatase [Kitasatospora sp. NPDC091276]|uniref:tyrosine-protein phosphatase n=1 Tax=Kitasatospora sp. NPDC091276 TaxID=3155300 RepID=UPI003422BCD5